MSVLLFVSFLYSPIPPRCVILFKKALPGSASYLCTFVQKVTLSHFILWGQWMEVIIIISTTTNKQQKHVQSTVWCVTRRKFSFTSKLIQKILAGLGSRTAMKEWRQIRIAFMDKGKDCNTVPVGTFKHCLFLKEISPSVFGPDKEKSTGL